VPPFWDAYWPTAFLACIGLAGTIIAVRTLRVIERQTKAAEDAAEAAKNNAQAVINSERAWVVPELHPHSYQGKDGRWYAEDRVPFSTADVLAGKHLIYSLRVTNRGKTPAQLLKFDTGYVTLAEGVTDLPEHPTDARARAGASAAPGYARSLFGTKEFNFFLVNDQGIEIEGPFDISVYMHDDWDAIKNLKKTAVFFGSIYYRTMFGGQEARSDYCYVYTPSLTRLSMVGRHTRYT